MLLGKQLRSELQQVEVAAQEAGANQNSEIKQLRSELQQVEAAAQEAGENQNSEIITSYGTAGAAALLSCAALVVAIGLGKRRAQPATAALTSNAKIDC